MEESGFMQSNYDLNNKKLAVYNSARFGMAHVSQNVSKHISDQGVNITYFTTPLNECPENVTKKILTPEWTGKTIKIFEKTLIYRPVALLVRNLYFWQEAFNHASRHLDEYDAVWFNGPHPLIWVLHRKKTASGPLAEKCLVTLHGQISVNQRESFDQLYYNIRKWAFIRALKDCCSGVSVVGPNIYEEVSNISSQTNLTEIGNGVDTELFQPTLDAPKIDSLRKFSESTMVFLSLGRLTEQKRPMKVLEVYRNITEYIEDSILLVAGKGEVRDKMEKYIYNHNMDSVEFLGYVSEEEKRRLYAYSNVFIQMSKYEGGNPPLTIAEAMASQCAILASEITDHRVVENANCGILIDLSASVNYAELAEDISKESDYMGVSGRKYAKANLEWKKISEDYINVLFSQSD